MENWKIYREDEIPKDVYIGISPMQRITIR